MAKGRSVNIGFLEAFLGLDDSEFYQGIKRAESSLAATGKKMQSIGKSMTTFITLPLVGVGYGAIKAAMDFEKAFSEIEGLVGIAREEVSMMNKEIKAMAGVTSRPPQELANALYFVTSSGIQGAAALDLVLQSGKAAAAGLGETNVIADLLSGTINAYGKENITAAKATDILVAAVREGKAEAPAFSTALGYVVPIAAEMGVEFEEVAAHIASMTRINIDAQTAATNLRQMFSDLLQPTKGAKEAMERMGTSAGELRRALREDGLLSVLRFFKEEMKDNEEAMSEIFGNVRSLTGALALVGENGDEAAQIFANLQHVTGDMDKAFQAAANTSTFKFNQGMAELKVAAIELGNALLPLFTDLVALVKDVANWFTSLNAESKKMVVIFGLLAAAIGPVMIVLGSVVSTFAAIGVAGFAVIGVIAGLAAAFIYVYENWEAIKERITDWTWWRNMLLDMITALYEYNPFVLLAQSAIEQYNLMTKTFATHINKMIDIWNGLMISMGKGGNTIKWITGEDIQVIDPFEKAVEGIQALKDNTKEYKTQFKSFTDSIVDFSKKAGDAIRGLFPSTSGGYGTGSGKPSDPRVPADVNVKTFKPAEKPAVTWFGDGPIKETTKAVVELDKVLKQVLSETLVELGEAFFDLFSGDMGAKTFFESLIDIVIDFLKSFGKALIAAAVAAIAFEDLIANPYAALAAGFALMVAAGAVKKVLKGGLKGDGGEGGTTGKRGGGGAIQGMAVGGYVSQGGVFQLHKDEMVSLPRGSAVTPAHMVNGGDTHVTVDGRIKGYYLELIAQKDKYRRKRLG